MLKNRRTDTYRHSLSLPASVRAPQTRNPLPENARSALIDLPVVSTFMLSFRSLLIATVSDRTDARLSLAGDFQTLRVRSTVAKIPATAAAGGRTTLKRAS